MEDNGEDKKMIRGERIRGVRVCGVKDKG